MVKVHREFWALPVFAGIALAIAAWQHHQMLWFLFYVSLACLGLTVVYRWRNWRIFQFQRQVLSGSGMVEAGSEAVVLLHVAVSSWLPVPWLDVRDCLPAALARPRQVDPGGRLVWLHRSSDNTLSYTLTDLPRGIHRWEALEVRSGDPLGMVGVKARLRQQNQLVVYPRTVNLNAWQFFPRRVDGTASAKTSLHQDLSQLIGVRDYQPGDRLSMIHWPSSAKTGKLQSKEFSPLLTDSSLVVLDCSKAAWEPGYNPSFEEAVSVAASLCKAAWLQRIPIRFYANWGKEPGQMTVASQTDFADLMLHLAAIAPLGSRPLSQSIYTEILTQGINVVIITPVIGSKLQRILFRLAGRGNEVTVVRIDDKTDSPRISMPRADGMFRLYTVQKVDDLKPHVATKEAVQ